jgi:hypothetical protein
MRDNYPYDEVLFDEFDPQWDEYELEDTEWKGEINRRSRDYIRWVQQALKKVMRLRLKVDGISGPQTRSAIRSFQKRRGLKVDGVVGPQTERALVCAGAPLPNLCRQTRSTKPPTTKPLINGGGTSLTGGCRQAEYVRLQSHCRQQATRYMVSCGTRFGLDYSKALLAATSVIGAAAGTLKVPPIAMIVGIVGGIASQTLSTKAIGELAYCMLDILRGYVTCVKNATDATNCKGVITATDLAV